MGVRAPVEEFRRYRGFAPAVWKLEWEDIVGELSQNRDFSNTL